jgi:hypothetical protein
MGIRAAIYIAIVGCAAAKNREAPPTIERATHLTQLVGCVATKNREAPPTIERATHLTQLVGCVATKNREAPPTIERATHRTDKRTKSVITNNYKSDRSCKKVKQNKYDRPPRFCDSQKCKYQIRYRLAIELAGARSQLQTY